MQTYRRSAKESGFRPKGIFEKTTICKLDFDPKESLMKEKCIQRNAYQRVALEEGRKEEVCRKSVDRKRNEYKERMEISPI